MGQNLTGQLVSATYEDLVQISGSVLTDGLGNDINNITVTSSFASQAGTAGYATNALSSSYAVTASFAENASGVPDALVTASISDATITFTKFNSSSFDITVNNVSSSISASYASQAGTAGFAVNGFPYTGDAAINGNLSVTGSIARQSGSFDGFAIDNLTTPTASEALDHIVVISQADYNAIAIPDPNTFYIINDATGSVIEGNLIVNGTLLVTGSATFQAGLTGSLFGTASFADQAGSSGFATTASFALTASSLVGGVSLQTVLDTGNTATQDIILTGDISATDITGSNGRFVNLTATSASFGYIQSVTGSAVYIGDSFVVVNADLPAVRYAGLAVFDSGSSPIASASLEWDSLNDTWITMEETGNTSVILTGPTGSKGSEVFPTQNRIQKGGTWNYLVDSNISDNGTTVSINSNTEVTGSLIVSAGITGSLEGTASFASQAGTAGFASQAGTAGFATTATSASFASQAGSSGFAISASFAETASYALNAQPGFPYTGSAEISGSLRVFVSGSVDGYTITSGSLTGSLIDNLTTPTSSEAIKHLVYLSQAEYDALTPDTNTMYVISGSGDVVENLTVSGSLVGEVNTLSISSNTASMDLSGGNFFTLQLVSGSDTRIEPSNIQAGQTINLLLSTTGSATVSFPSTVKQVSGSSYVPTTTTSKDVVTFISFDTSDLYLSNVKNLV